MVRPVVPLMSFLFMCIFSISPSAFSHDGLDGDEGAVETVLSRIERAFWAGEIDRETALLNKAFALFGPERLAPQFQSDTAGPSKCATPVVLEIQAAWEDLSPVAQKILAPYIQRPPTQHAFNSPGGLFKIHYDTSGPHAVFQPYKDSDPDDGIPDYVNRCAEIFDHVWTMQVDTLGYDVPPSDGTKGGDARYDVYLRHQPGAYGVAFPEDHSSQYPGRNAWTSYIYVDPTYDGFGYSDPLDPLSVTAAHELFHAIQFAYNLGAGTWYMEISSVWMEDVLYDEVNDYRAYLRSFYDLPEVSLDSSEPSLHQYGSCVWNFFLAESYGTDIVRQIWEECITSSPVSGFNAVIALYGSSRDEAFRQFTVWNYLTGPRANGSHPHYEEASDFPSVYAAEGYSTYPVFDGTVAYGDLPDHLASNYVRFSSDGSPGDLKIFFTGEDRFNWRVSVVVDSADRFTSTELGLEGVSGFVRIPHWGDKQEAVLIPCVVSTSGASGGYTFSAVVAASDEPDFVLEDVEADDTGGGNGDGYIDPGESIRLTLTLTNFGAPATDIWATLTSQDPEILIEEGDVSFGHIAENGTGDNSGDPFLLSVEETAELHKAQCTLTLLSNGRADTAQMALHLVVGHPQILLVDDDYQSLPRPETFDVEGYYRSPLDGLDEIYDYWAIEHRGTPDLTLLNNYRTIIWFTGYAAPALTSQDQDNLASFLEGGGRLFLTGQDIASELRSSDFLRDYVHAQFIRNESGSGIIYGVEDDPISGDILFFSILGDPGANNQVSPDVIAPLDGAGAVFTYGPPSYEKAAVKFDGDSYRVVFFSFGFEGIVNLLGETQTLRRQIMSDLLSWLNFQPQKADVNGDGRIELPDLIRTVHIILGIEPAPTEYELWAADCNGDGEINVLDVVGIANTILGIGTCSPVGDRR